MTPSKDLFAALPFALRRRLMKYHASSIFWRYTILFAPGLPIGHGWIVRSGIVKSYGYDETGNRRIGHFYMKGDLLGLEEKLLSKTSTHIEVVENASVIPIDPEVSNELLYHQTEQVIIHILERHQNKTNLLLLPAKERFQTFGKHFPIARLTVNEIAAYLHLAPETISRLRSKIR